MLKVTLNFTFYCIVFLFCGCEDKKNEPSDNEIQHYRDSLSEARIDSAYLEMKMNCETMMVYEVPKMVDSFLKDSALLQTFFDNKNVYNDADTKVEKVIRQLQADCDSNLLKETYRIARLRQKLKPKQHKKLKV
jgi:hypothetical protein